MKFFKVTVQSVLIFCVVSIVSTAVTVDNSAQNAAENLEKLPAENLEKVPAEIFVKVLDDIPAEVNADVSGKAPEKVTTEVLIDVSTNNSTVVSTDGSTEAPTNIEILCGAAGSCTLVGGGTLCNDRCKKCSGPSGQYKRGACCGLFWQTCCCYYS